MSELVDFFEEIGPLASPVRCHRTVGRYGHEEILSAGFLREEDVSAVARKQTMPQFTLLYLLRGCGTYSSAGGRTVRLRPGDLALRFPERSHTVTREQNGEWVEFFLTYPRPLFEALLELGTVSQRVPVLHPGLDQVILQRSQEFLALLRDEVAPRVPRALAASHQLLVDLVEMDRHGRTDNPASSPIADACRILSGNLDVRLAMPRVADQVGLGYEHFRKVFRGTTGMSPKEFRLRKRIECAQELLSQPGQRLKVVAGVLGYPDVASFAKQFKATVGVTPGAFRRALR